MRGGAARLGAPATRVLWSGAAVGIDAIAVVSGSTGASHPALSLGARPTRCDVLSEAAEPGRARRTFDAHGAQNPAARARRLQPRRRTCLATRPLRAAGARARTPSADDVTSPEPGELPFAAVGGGAPAAARARRRLGVRDARVDGCSGPRGAAGVGRCAAARHLRWGAGQPYLGLQMRTGDKLLLARRPRDDRGGGRSVTAAYATTPSASRRGEARSTRRRASSTSRSAASNDRGGPARSTSCVRDRALVGDADRNVALLVDALKAARLAAPKPSTTGGDAPRGRSLRGRDISNARAVARRAARATIRRAELHERSTLATLVVRISARTSRSSRRLAVACSRRPPRARRAGRSARYRVAGLPRRRRRSCRPLEAAPRGARRGAAPAPIGAGRRGRRAAIASTRPARPQPVLGLVEGAPPVGGTAMAQIRGEDVHPAATAVRARPPRPARDSETPRRVAARYSRTELARAEVVREPPEAATFSSGAGRRGARLRRGRGAEASSSSIAVVRRDAIRRMRVITSSVLVHVVRRTARRHPRNAQASTHTSTTAPRGSTARHPRGRR